MRKEKRIVIVGAGGYIGTYLTQYFTSWCRNNGEVARLFLCSRDKTPYTNRESKSIRHISADITAENFPDQVRQLLGGEHADYLLHCAAPTKSAYMVSNPVETADAVVVGTRNVLKLARELHVGSMVYLSSMEVYGIVDENRGLVGEEELGDIDLFNVRSCYSLGKRMAEYYCYSYYREYGVPVKIARLAQTFGEGVPLEDNRVFAQFGRSVASGQDIVLHTKGNSVGNYVYIGDAANAILTLLLRGRDGEAYNVVNEENTMSVAEMAQLAAGLDPGGKVKVVFDIPKENRYGYAPATGLRLSAEKLRALGWTPVCGLEEMYRRMITDMQVQR